MEGLDKSRKDPTHFASKEGQHRLLSNSIGSGCPFLDDAKAKRKFIRLLGAQAKELSETEISELYEHHMKFADQLITLWIQSRDQLTPTIHAKEGN